jgi:hypothetical protein
LQICHGMACAQAWSAKKNALPYRIRTNGSS